MKSQSAQDSSLLHCKQLYKLVHIPPQLVTPRPRHFCCLCVVLQNSCPAECGARVLLCNEVKRVWSLISLFLCFWEDEDTVAGPQPYNHTVSIWESVDGGNTLQTSASPRSAHHLPEAGEYACVVNGCISLFIYSKFHFFSSFLY